MSVGAYDYIGWTVKASLNISLSNIERIAERLERDYPGGIPTSDVRTFLQRWEELRDLCDNLFPIWKAVEQADSFDISEEELVEQLKIYATRRHHAL